LYSWGNGWSAGHSILIPWNIGRRYNHIPSFMRLLRP
jgi:hypothetical protein